MRQTRSGKSSYQRHHKAPYLYSTALQNLIAAVKAGKDGEAARFRMEHNAQFPLTGGSGGSAVSTLPRRGRHVWTGSV